MKNAITVIDQELIDYIEDVIESKSIDVGMVAVCRFRLDELLSMAKDLIEINAELTKREQKYKRILRKFRDNPEHISSSLMCDVMAEIDSMKLKGEE